MRERRRVGRAPPMKRTSSVDHYDGQARLVSCEREAMVSNEPA